MSCATSSRRAAIAASISSGASWIAAARPLAALASEPAMFGARSWPIGSVSWMFWSTPPGYFGCPVRRAFRIVCASAVVSPRSWPTTRAKIVRCCGESARPWIGSSTTLAPGMNGAGPTVGVAGAGAAAVARPRSLRICLRRSRVSTLWGSVPLTMASIARSPTAMAPISKSVRTGPVRSGSVPRGLRVSGGSDEAGKGFPNASWSALMSSGIGPGSGSGGGRWDGAAPAICEGGTDTKVVRNSPLAAVAARAWSSLAREAAGFGAAGCDSAETAEVTRAWTSSGADGTGPPASGADGGPARGWGSGATSAVGASGGGFCSGAAAAAGGALGSAGGAGAGAGGAGAASGGASSAGASSAGGCSSSSANQSPKSAASTSSSSSELGCSPSSSSSRRSGSSSAGVAATSRSGSTPAAFIPPARRMPRAARAAAAAPRAGTACSSRPGCRAA